LQSLERYLGVRLFARAQRGFELTHAGLVYWNEIQPALLMLASATAKIRSFAAENDTIYLSVPPTLLQKWLMPRLRDFLDQNAEIRIQFTPRLMVWWGRHSDRTGERRWHTAIPLLLIAAGLGSTMLTGVLVPVVVMLCMILIGAYSFKGPFWAMASGWLASGSAAAGLAGINAVSNLIGGGLMVNVYGWVKEATGSYALALMPLAVLSFFSVVTLLYLSRKPGAATAVSKVEKMA
jgi:hypothetical protein